MPAVPTNTPNTAASGGDPMKVCKDLVAIAIARVIMKRANPVNPQYLLKAGVLDYAYELYEHDERNVDGSYKYNKSRLPFNLSQLLSSGTNVNNMNAANIVNKVLYMTLGNQLIGYVLKDGSASWGVNLTDFIVGLGAREVVRNYA